MWVLNYRDICWKDNTVGHKQSRSFLECVDDFLIQTVKESVDRGALSDLINKKGQGEM